LLVLSSEDNKNETVLKLSTTLP